MSYTDSDYPVMIANEWTQTNTRGAETHVDATATSAQGS